MGLLIFLGIFAGLLSGLLGVGGGIIIVPMLNYYFQKTHLFSSTLSIHVAIGTSLAIIFLTILTTSLNYYYKKLVQFDILKLFIPGLILGTFTGSFLNSYFNHVLLEKCFAFFLILIAINIAFQPQKNQVHPSVKKPNLYLVVILSIIIGICAGLFGIGGGIMMIPYFNYIGMQLLTAIGTSSICLLPITFFGTLSSVFFGLHQTHQSLTTGFVYWPTVLPVAITSMIFSPIGTNIAKKLPENKIKILLIILLLTTSIKIMLE